MPIGKGCKRASVTKAIGGAHVEQRGHDVHYGPAYSAEWFYMNIETKKHTYKGNSFYKHYERPLEDECRTQRERQVIKEHVNDKEIKYKEIKDVSK